MPERGGTRSCPILPGCGRRLLFTLEHAARDFGPGACKAFLCAAGFAIFALWFPIFLRARHRRCSTTKSGGYNAAGCGGLRALLPGRLLPELLACLVVLLVCPVVLPVFFHFTGLEPGLHRSRPGLLGKPIRPDRDARSASWAFQGGRNGGKEAGHRRRRQVDSQASSQARRQASKQAGGQVARQGLTSNPTAHGDLVNLIQKKTILCFNHYYTPPYRVSISSHISCSQEYSK